MLNYNNIRDFYNIPNNSHNAGGRPLHPRGVPVRAGLHLDRVEFVGRRGSLTARHRRLEIDEGARRHFHATRLIRVRARRLTSVKRLLRV